MGALIVLVVLVVLLIVLPGIRIINQYERGVVLRLGKYSRTLEPGFRVIIPYIDKIDIIFFAEINNFLFLFVSH